MKKRIVILGAGESGAGSAVLAQQKGFDVFVSDSGTAKDKYREILVSHGIVMGGQWWPNEAVDKADDLAHYVPAEGATHVHLASRHFGCNC